MLRPQQILLMREPGLGLSEIAKVLDDQLDRVTALRAHHQRLVAEHDRFDTLAHTVSRTIAEPQAGKDDSMPKINEPENLFEGFDASRHGSDVQERWPQEWEKSRRYADTLTAGHHERMQRETAAQMVRMAGCMAGLAPRSPTPRTGRGGRSLPGHLPVLDPERGRVQPPRPDLRRRPTAAIGVRPGRRRASGVPG